MTPDELPPDLRAILDLARWAPSGDNTQPWRFEVLAADHVLVHGLDTRTHCVYDLDGHGSHLAHGALLETLALAATTHGRRAEVRRRPDTPDSHLLFDVRLVPDPSVPPDPLAAHIERRTVQRRPLSTRPLTAAQKAALAAAVGNLYSVLWFEGLSRRWAVARLCFDNAKIRLNIPEAYAVHKAVIEWGARYSEDRIPSRAIGVDPLTERLMRWVMANWGRVGFFNTWLLGDLAPRLQLDLLPGLACAAHFALLAARPVETVDDYVAAGRALQRFWLAATAQGLWLQPLLTPVVFARFARRGLAFTGEAWALARARALNGRLEALLAGRDVERLFFLGRLGAGPAPQARSTRLPLGRLLAP